MQVAFLIESLSNKAGMERVLTGVANSLCDCINVSIITACQFNSRYAFDIDEKIMLIDLGVELNKKAYRRGLEKCLLEKRFDVVVSMGGMESFFVTEIKDGSKKILWYNFSYDYYEVLFGRGINALLHRLKRNLVVRDFDCLVVLNSDDAESWKRWNGNVRKIYNPVFIDVNGLSSLDDKKVISVGRLDWMKGFDMLIDVWKIVAEHCKGWRLNVYGEGGMRKEMECKISTLGLEESISLCGIVNDIEDKYLESSLLVCSSRSEAFGLMIVEAESCGLPIVSFDCPSSPRELINDGENGFLVPLGDVGAMADAIVEILEDYELRKQMGKKSVELAKRFDVAEIRDAWVALFDDVMVDF